MTTLPTHLVPATGTDPNRILQTEGADNLRHKMELLAMPWDMRISVIAGSSLTDAAPASTSFRFVTSKEIIEADYPPLTWAVPGYVPEGFSVLAGRQKLGKSRMALDMSVAVATGGPALGKIDCDHGDVLYLDLENGQRRVQRRLNAMFSDELRRPCLERLEWAFEAPSIGPDLFKMLDDWRSKVQNPRLVVIDVLQRVKPSGGSNSQTSYERDYSLFAPLQTYATQTKIAILALHHTRKGGADDPLEALSGSNGLSAVADTTLLLNRDAQGTTLYVRGRDVEEKDTALINVGGQWHLQGDASVVRQSAQRAQIIAALRESDGPMSPRYVADVTGGKSQSVRQTMLRMATAGEIERVGRGQYTIPCHIGHIRHIEGHSAENAAETVALLPAADVTEDRDTSRSCDSPGDNTVTISSRPDATSDTVVTVVTDVTGPRAFTAATSESCPVDQPNDPTLDPGGTA